jgi:excisionase family DNA binding protein
MRNDDLKQQTDDALLELALAKNQRAWREIVRRHDSTMHEVASDANFDAPAVEDVVADVWVALLEDDMRRLRIYDSARGVPLGEWLNLQATRVAARHLKRQATSPALLSRDEVERLPDPRTIGREPPRARPTSSSVDSAIRLAVAEAVRDVVRIEVRAALHEERPSHTEVGADPYLSIAEAAKFAGVHEATIRSWISRGHVPGYRAGRHRRIKRAELERFMTRVSDEDSVDIDARAAKLAAV